MVMSPEKMSRPCIIKIRKKCANFLPRRVEAWNFHMMNCIGRVGFGLVYNVEHWIGFICTSMYNSGGGAPPPLGS
jgi:hypothetical protein